LAFFGDNPLFGDAPLAGDGLAASPWAASPLPYWARTWSPQVICTGRPGENPLGGDDGLRLRSNSARTWSPQAKVTVLRAGDGLAALADPAAEGVGLPRFLGS